MTAQPQIHKLDGNQPNAEPEDAAPGSATISVETLYNEAAANCRYLSDWRHRIMSRFFVMLSAFSVAAGWLWKTSDADLQRIVWIPFLLAAVASIIFLLMDRRNTRLLEICCATAKNLENNTDHVAGIYSARETMTSTAFRNANYNTAIYALAAVFAAAMFVGTLIKFGL